MLLRRILIKGGLEGRGSIVGWVGPPNGVLVGFPSLWWPPGICPDFGSSPTVLYTPYHTHDCEKRPSKELNRFQNKTTKMGLYYSNRHVEQVGMAEAETSAASRALRAVGVTARGGGQCVRLWVPGAGLLGSDNKRYVNQGSQG